MTARGNGIRDICSITGDSKDKVQAALHRSEHEIQPTQKHYDVLQVDEFHTFVGHKKNKVWLIYAYITNNVLTCQSLCPMRLTHDAIF